MFKIFVDTDSDFTLEECRKYDLGLISMPYEWEGKNVYPYFDYETLDFHAFYEKLRGGLVPSTSAVNAEEYKQLFEPFFKEGRDIIYITFSQKLSSTFNGVRLAMEKLKELYPDRNLYMIDTKGITGLSYAAGIEIIEYIQSGDHSIEEIRAFAEELVEHTACYLYADNLKFFAKSGRVSGMAALMGGIIGIKPIIYLDQEGYMLTKEKARGRQNAIERLKAIVNELALDAEKHIVCVTHTDFPEGAKIICDFARAKFGNDIRIIEHQVNPTNGCHSGPDCVSIAFHAKHR